MLTAIAKTKTTVTTTPINAVFANSGAEIQKVKIFFKLRKIKLTSVFLCYPQSRKLSISNTSLIILNQLKKDKDKLFN